MNRFSTLQNIEYSIFASGIAYGHTFFITKNGRLGAFGKNEEDQLFITPKKGRRTGMEFNVPTQCNKFPNVSVLKCACGYKFSLVLTAGNLVYAIGENEYGQLANGKMELKSGYGMYKQKKNQKNVDDPEEYLVKSLKNEKIIDVATGYDHSIFVSASSIYVAGKNTSGQLGIGDDIKNQPNVRKMRFFESVLNVVAGHSFTLILSRRKELFLSGNLCEEKSFFIPTGIKCNEKIKKITCGYSHFIAITESGKFMAQGDNEYGQMFQNTDIIRNYHVLTEIKEFSKKKIVDVQSGAYHYLILCGDGKVWGIGYAGALSTGSTGKQCSPLLLKENGVQIICAGDRSMIFDKNGDIWTTGINYDGQLGIGNSTENKKYVKNELLAKVIEVKQKNMDSFFPFLRKIIDNSSFFDVTVVTNLV